MPGIDTCARRRLTPFLRVGLLRKGKTPAAGWQVPMLFLPGTTAKPRLVETNAANIHLHGGWTPSPLPSQPDDPERPDAAGGPVHHFSLTRLIPATPDRTTTNADRLEGDGSRILFSHLFFFCFFSRSAPPPRPGRALAGGGYCIWRSLIEPVVGDRNEVLMGPAHPRLGLSPRAELEVNLAATRPRLPTRLPHYYSCPGG